MSDLPEYYTLRRPVKAWPSADNPGAMAVDFLEDFYVVSDESFEEEFRPLDVIETSKRLGEIMENYAEKRMTLSVGATEKTLDGQTERAVARVLVVLGVIPPPEGEQ